jgi:hypothetical protein
MMLQSKRIILTLGLMIVLSGSLSGILSQTRPRSESGRIESRIEKIENDSASLITRSAENRERIVKLEMKVEGMGKTLDSIWNFQLGTLSGVIILIVSSLFKKPKDE